MHERHPTAREVGDELLQVDGVLEQAALASVHDRELAVWVATARRAGDPCLRRALSLNPPYRPVALG